MDQHSFATALLPRPSAAAGYYADCCLRLANGGPGHSSPLVSPFGPTTAACCGPRRLTGRRCIYHPACGPRRRGGASDWILKALSWRRPCCLCQASSQSDCLKRGAQGASAKTRPIVPWIPMRRRRRRRVDRGCCCCTWSHQGTGADGALPSACGRLAAERRRRCCWRDAPRVMLLVWRVAW